MSSEKKFPLWMIGYMAIGLIGLGTMCLVMITAKPPNWWFPIVFGTGVLTYATWDYVTTFVSDDD